MTVEMPYFMTNEKWYYYDEEEYRWKLTEKAHQKRLRVTKSFTRQ